VIRTLYTVKGRDFSDLKKLRLLSTVSYENVDKLHYIEFTNIYDSVAQVKILYKYNALRLTFD